MGRKQPLKGPCPSEKKQHTVFFNQSYFLGGHIYHLRTDNRTA